MGIRRKAKRIKTFPNSLLYSLTLFTLGLVVTTDRYCTGFLSFLILIPIKTNIITTNIIIAKAIIPPDIVILLSAYCIYYFLII